MKWENEMKQPVLVILAAGMGSRYGGLKQMESVDGCGHKIIDFSVYDAVRAGFQKVIFIIKKENEADFRKYVGDPMSGHVHVEYAYQNFTVLPSKCCVPGGREKPLGTAHAVYCCKDLVDGPFAVINADDFYGRDGFAVLYKALLNARDDDKYRYTMVSYRLGNTLTDFGTVSRGCCTVDETGVLETIVERTKIMKTETGAAFSEDEGVTYKPISPDTRVSMNMWGFTESLLTELDDSMKLFFQKDMVERPLTAECYLPFEVDRLLKEEKASVHVLLSKDKWYGITYREDRPTVMEGIQALKDQGVYPEYLWR